MPSLWKHPNSPYFMCCYTAADGRQLKRTTKQKVRAKALEVCLGIQRVEDLAKADALTEQAAKKVIGEIVERTTGSPLHNFRTDDWLAQWVEQKQQIKGAESTAERYAQVAREFKAAIGKRAQAPLAAITSQDILTYRKAELAAGKSPKTANTAVKCLSTAFNKAYKSGYIPLNPCIALESLEEDSSIKEAFTAKQLQSLLDNSEGDWRRAILFGYFTGARLGDVVAMTWDKINLKEHTITFKPKKTRKKLKKDVVIPVHPDLEAALLERPGVGTAPVFPDLHGQDTGGKYGLSSQFSKIMEKAGISPKITQHTPTGRKNTSLSFHSLRHTFTSAMANAGVSPEIRMKMTGHTKADTHAIYTHHELKPLRAAIKSIPRIQAG